MSYALGATGSQLAQLRHKFPGAAGEALPDGTVLVSVPNIALPVGWNQISTAVRFLAPVGYPTARPDCFFADGTLRLANGGMPANTNVQQLPGGAEVCVWFSWHVAAWNPATDTLVTYLRVIVDRLGRIQ